MVKLKRWWYGWQQVSFESLEIMDNE